MQPIFLYYNLTPRILERTTNVECSVLNSLKWNTSEIQFKCVPERRLTCVRSCGSKINNINLGLVIMNNVLITLSSVDCKQGRELAPWYQPLGASCQTMRWSTHGGREIQKTIALFSYLRTQGGCCYWVSCMKPRRMSTQFPPGPFAAGGGNSVSLTSH